MLLCIRKPKMTFVENEEVLNHLIDNSVFDSEGVLIGEDYEYVRKFLSAAGKAFYLLTNEDGEVCIMQEDDGNDVFEEIN